MISLLLPFLAQADTTLNVSNHAAFGANLGWINMRGDVTNGAVVGQYFCTGYVWSANCGWISLGNGPTNGWHYMNTSAADWGLNHNGAGQLSGYAYGANIGWLTFEQMYGKPWIDLANGTLTGYVWSANTGWISLSNLQAFVRTDRLHAGPDLDGDTIPDPWERQMTGNTHIIGVGDSDFDGHSDVEEYLADTDPRNPTDRLRISGFSSLPEACEVTWSASQTRRYRLLYSIALTGTVQWVDSGLGVMVPDPGDTMIRNVARSAAATSRFYRVSAVIPLNP